MEFKMKKIANLTDGMYNRISKDGELDSSLRELLGISKTKKMRIGDSLCTIGQLSKTKDVFKIENDNREMFYVVINPLNEEMAFCYTIYPCK